MTTRRIRRAGTVLSAALMVAATAGLGVAPVGAIYLSDGSRQTGPGTYENPDDGMCVIGIKANGDMLVDTNITNARDCAAYTTNLTGMTTQATCAPAAVGANLPVSPATGWRHVWTTSSSFCRDSSNPAIGISRVGLDNTAAMCTSQGGTLGTPGTCTAFGWFYRGLRADDTVLPITGSAAAPPFDTPNYVVWQGATATDGLGFCHNTMDFTNAVTPSYTRPTTYPQAAASNECPMFYPDNPSGRVRTGTSWSDYVWNWDFNNIGPPGVPPPSGVPGSGGAKCRYAYGVRGLFYSAISATVAGSGPAPAFNTTTKYDLTTAAFDTQGKCLANGLTWENWVPRLPIVPFVDATVRGAHPSPLSTTPCAAATDCYANLDLTTLEKNGGGKFTSRQCLRCHSDQSRGPAERDKPGFVKHGHKLTGDSMDPVRAAIGDPWGVKGVQCSVCHAAANPHVSDIIQRDATGAAKTTSAHEQSQYGAAVTQVCYTCHSDATAGPMGPTGGSATPAAVIPVSGGGLAQNAQHLDPIVNQFLNSPHARYSGTSSAAEIQDKSFYDSPFVGNICRATGFAAGDILTTVYRNGGDDKIHTPDTATNLACTNPGDGSATSGAAGQWVAEGSDLSNSQGNCMTCHDPHWSLHDPNPEAEPFRRECVTCHSHPEAEASFSGAPQIDLTTINHLAGAGTPLENFATEPNEPCEICHMPASSAGGQYMHLWRINTSPTYTTMGATQVNTSPDGTYTDAAWIDLDHACGQCHGGDSGPASPGVPYFSKADLAPVAEGMHDGAGVSYPIAFSYSRIPNTLGINVNARIKCLSCPTFTYDWDWGDGSAHGTADPDTHTYSSAGRKTITLTVRLASNGKKVGSVRRRLRLRSVDLAPTAAATCTWNADTWTMTVTDTSSDDGPDPDGLADASPSLQIVEDWGDGSLKTISAAGATVAHTYLRPGTFTVSHRANDEALQTSVVDCATAATPAYFTISGTVYLSNGTTPVSSAVVSLRRSSRLIKLVNTVANGTFTAAGLKPGAYTLTVSKAGHTFPAGPVITIGPSSAGNTINAVTP